MLTQKRMGASLVEWIVVVVIVVGLLGSVALAIATAAQGKGNGVTTWINNLTVP